MGHLRHRLQGADVRAARFPRRGEGLGHLLARGLPGVQSHRRHAHQLRDSDAQQPVSITLDLGRRRQAAYLAVNQRESSPTHARVSFGRPEDSARIKDYLVYASNDGVHWGQPVKQGAMPSARGVQFIDIGQQHARYLKLEILNTWGGPQAPRFHRQLQIDEIRVATGYHWRPWPPLPYEAEHYARKGLDFCPSCSGSFQVIGRVDYPDVTVAEAGTYSLQIDYTAPTTVSVNGGPPVAVNNPAMAVPLQAGANRITLNGAVDRIAVTPLLPESYVPRTTLTVEPHGVQWVGPGQQSVRIEATLRLDVDDPLDQVSLAPTAPAGWSVQGGPATATTMRLGQTLRGSWTVTSPPGQDIGSARIPVTAAFQLLGRAKQRTTNVDVRLRPADRVFMREAEDSANLFGSTGLTGCGPCSGGEKVRNIGGGSDAHVVFPNVDVAQAGEYTLFIDFTVNGTRSFFVSANGGPPTEVSVTGLGNNTPYSTTVRISLQSGANTIRVFNDGSSAPDLDRLSLQVAQ